MDITREEINKIVARVMESIKDVPEKNPHRQPDENSLGIFDDIDSAIKAAKDSQSKFVEIPLEKRKEIIANIRKRATENVEMLSRLAVDETGMGRYEDKIKKNLLVINKTPGVEILEPLSFTGDDGLTLLERAPYGIIGSITPCTNPSETVICNSIGMIAGGNGVVFNGHPTAKKTTLETIKIINAAIIECGGPANLITAISNPTIGSAQTLMKHPDIKLLVVTGGPAVVQVAMSSGKKVIAAGPGNPPVVIDETADIRKAAESVYLGASLDNNIVCIVEKEVFIVEEVFEEFRKAFKACGAYEITRSEASQLEKHLLKDGVVNKDYVGKNASELLKLIDINVSGDPRLIFAELDARHPFVREELLMPVIPIVKVKDVDEGIRLAKEVEHGNRHTAVMHSRNIENLHKMARVIDTSIFVKNAPSYAGVGLGGEGYTSFTIASPTGEGLTTAIHFTRERRCTLAGYFRIV